MNLIAQGTGKIFQTLLGKVAELGFIDFASVRGKMVYFFQYYIVKPYIYLYVSLIPEVKLFLTYTPIIPRDYLM